MGRSVRVLAGAASLAVVGVLLPAAPAAAGSCSGTAWAPPSPKGTKWGPPSRGCAVFGDNDTKIHYNWWADVPEAQLVCVQGWGYPLLQGPTKDGRKLRDKGQWLSLGCGRKGGTHVYKRSIEWGNNLGPTKVRAQSVNVLPARVHWEH